MNLILIGLGLLLPLSFGTSDYLSKGVATRIGSYKTSVFQLLLSGVITLFPGLVLSSSFKITAASFVVLLFVALTTFISFAALYRAYSHGMLSLTAPIVNAFPTFSLIISVAVLGASFSVGSVAALAVVILGIVLVSTSFSDLRKNLFSRGGMVSPGVGSALAAAVFFGASWTAYGYASQSMGYLLPTIAVRLGAATVGLLAAPIFKENLRPKFYGSFSRLLAMAILESAGVVTFSLGVVIAGTPDAIPILSTFGGMSAAVTVAYAMTLLKEKLELNHVIGVVMLISGVVALIYLTG